MIDWNQIRKNFFSSRWIGWYALIGILYLLSFYFGAVGVFSDWYNRLKRPPWDPGLTITVIAGVIVYILSFWGFFYAFEKIQANPLESKETYEFFMIAITLSTGILTIWTYLFFIVHAVALSILFMVFAVLIYLFVVVELLLLSPWGGLLNIPYLLWLLFFLIFTVWIYLENPEVRGITR